MDAQAIAEAAFLGSWYSNMAYLIPCGAAANSTAAPRAKLLAQAESSFLTASTLGSIFHLVYNSEVSSEKVKERLPASWIDPVIAQGLTEVTGMTPATTSKIFINSIANGVGSQYDPPTQKT